MSQSNPDAFRFRCSACSKTIRIPNTMRGKSGKCPQCGHVFRIPAADETREPSLTKGSSMASDATPESDSTGINPTLANKARPAMNAPQQLGNAKGDPLVVSKGIQTLDSRASVAVWLLRFTILIMGIHCYIFWLFFENGRTRTLNLAQQATLIAQLALCLITAVFFLRWKYQAYLNLQRACSSPLKFSPGWCCGFYFIPIVNLYRPFQAMNEIQARSKANIGYQVYVWWACWLLSAFVSRATWNARNVQLDRLCIVTIVSLCAAMIAGLFLLKIIKSVTEKQQRYRLALDPHAAT